LAHIGRPPKQDVEIWAVTDDWPERVPIAERAAAMLESSAQQVVTSQMVQRLAKTARERIRIDGGGYRRDHLRVLGQRVEVADREVRIIGSKTNLLQMLTAVAGTKSAGCALPAMVSRLSTPYSRQRPRDYRLEFGGSACLFRARTRLSSSVTW
jgi:hypothetical protein